MNIESAILAGKPVSYALARTSVFKYVSDEEAKEVFKVLKYVLSEYKKRGPAHDSGLPAILHPVKVAQILDFDPYLMQLSLLHDIIEHLAKNSEEAKALQNDIKKRFGKKIAKDVWTLTNKQYYGPKDSTRQGYIKYTHNIRSPTCLIVKQAGILDNLRTLTGRKLKTQKSFLPDKVPLTLNHVAAMIKAGKHKHKNPLYELAALKYYHKILDELFLQTEVKIKHFREQGRYYQAETNYFTDVYDELKKEYKTKRNKAFEVFVNHFVKLAKTHEAAKIHLSIEREKRIKDNLLNLHPMGYAYGQIKENIYLINKLKTSKLFDDFELQEFQDTINYAIEQLINHIGYYERVYKNLREIEPHLRDEWRVDFPREDKLGELKKLKESTLKARKSLNK